MDESTARERLALGIAHLDAKAEAWKTRDAYHRGDQALPYAPPGSSVEYMALRKQAPANWLKIAMGAPVQRCQAEGIRSGSKNRDADATFWANVWKSNRMASRQGVVYTEAMVHGRGVMSVSADPKTPERPRVLVESDRRVHIEGHEDDPFKPAWAVKRLNLPDTKSPLLGPDGRPLSTRARVYVYDDESWVQFDRNVFGGTWQITAQGEHNLGDVPFVPFDVEPDADGRPRSAMEPLMPAQDALNAIRFFALLATQFAAARQRAVTGFDPTLRDAAGNVIYKTDELGGIVLDAQGQPIPLTVPMGTVAVDRLWAFPGKDTKVWDLTESNLENYVKLYEMWLTDFFGRGQVPPQYLLNKMANLSGDALTGAESTLTSLVAQLQRGWGESLLQVSRLAKRAQGEDDAELLDAEVLWGDGEARSFAQTTDAIVKLVSSGFPREAAWAMIPGANPDKVADWIAAADAERNQADAALMAQVERNLQGAQV